MQNKTADQIARLNDGSIDYAYYTEQGAMARNGEVKRTVSKVTNWASSRHLGMSSLFSVVLLVIIL